MAKLNEKQLLLAITGVTVLLCGGAGAGIWWATDLVEQEKESIQGKRAQILAARAKIAKIPGVERDVIVLRENVHEYVKILPAEKEVTTFMRSANTFASQAGVGVENFAPVRQNNRGGAFERVVYRFEFQANLWKFLKLLNFFENHERFVKVRDIRLTSRRPDTRMSSEPVHSISITVETYTYNRRNQSKLVSIPNYVNKRDKLRHVIAASLQTLSLEKYEFKGQEGRRDIFLDPREFTSGRDDGPISSGRIPTAQQRVLIKQYKDQLAKLVQMWEASNEKERTIFERYELRQKVNKGIMETQVAVADIDKKNMISNQALRVRWFKEIQQPLNALKTKVANLEEADDYLASKDFKKLIQKVKDFLVSGELDAAIHQYESVQAKTEVEPDDSRYPLRVLLEGLLIRARVAKEFASMTLNISGVVVNGGGKSGLILNGKVYEEGDFVTDQLFVKSVHREEVEFVFKSFTLVKTW